MHDPEEACISAKLPPPSRFASRPPSLGKTPATIEQAFRSALYGRPGPTYIDLVRLELSLADLLKASTKVSPILCLARRLHPGLNRLI